MCTQASSGQGVEANKLSSWTVDVTDYLNYQGKFLGTQRLRERQRTGEAAVFAEKLLMVQSDWGWGLVKGFLENVLG